MSAKFQWGYPNGGDKSTDFQPISRCILEMVQDRNIITMEAFPVTNLLQAFSNVIFTARRYASAVYAVVVCPSVRLSDRPSVRHKPALYQKRLNPGLRKQRRTPRSRRNSDMSNGSNRFKSAIFDQYFHTVRTKPLPG